MVFKEKSSINFWFKYNFYTWVQFNYDESVFITFINIFTKY